jgi:primosomal replication protein N
VKRNQFLLDAEILDVGPLKRTPAGIETVALRLKHRSEQDDAGASRRAELTIDASAFGELAPRLGELAKGQAIAVKGFLTKRNHASDIPVLIIHEFRLIPTR